MTLDTGTPQQEPSVLDYVKSKLYFWKQEEIGIPAAPEEPGEPKPAREPLRLPWRSLLALFLALGGQRSLEPPGRNSHLGIVFYVLAAGFLLWAYFRGEWRLPSLPDGEQQTDPLTMRLLPLAISLVLAVIAFTAFNDNLFTGLNVALWVLAVFFFIWAVWLKDSQGEAWFTRLKSWLSNKELQVKISRWALLLLTVAAVVIFFRVYRLNSVPLEPTSDHKEKILDVYDITQGQTHIFFPRNTGREGFQMYLTAAVAWIFGTGLSFLSLKIGTVLCGLATLPYLYLLGKEIGNKRVGLLAVLFAGMAYWPNVISRFGLRFPLYPLFAAPTLYYLIRGLRRQNRNDFILSGLFLGLGLHGYTPIRIVPVMVVIAIGLYFLHRQSKGNRGQTIIWLSLLTLASLLIFLPLLRYFLEDPQSFGYRTLTRVGTIEAPYPGPVWQIFFSNVWNALRMFNWNDGEIWVHSVPYRPALDVVSGALFLMGVVLVLVRYIRRRHWLDLFLLLSIPLLQLPSILSLAFPGENPALNRASGAIVPVFLIVALSLDGLLSAFGMRTEALSTTPMSSAAGTGFEGAAAPAAQPRRRGQALGWLVMGLLVFWSAAQNYNLVFKQYDQQYRLNSWNSSEMGEVIKQFGQTYGRTDTVWIVPYPYWVDTVLPGIWAGIPNRDFAVWPDQLSTTLLVPGPKLFMFRPEDTAALDSLQMLYPQGSVSLFTSKEPTRDFMIFFVP